LGCIDGAYAIRPYKNAEYAILHDHFSDQKKGQYILHRSLSDQKEDRAVSHNPFSIQIKGQYISHRSLFDQKEVHAVLHELCFDSGESE